MDNRQEDERNLPRPGFPKTSQGSYGSRINLASGCFWGTGPWSITKAVARQEVCVRKTMALSQWFFNGGLSLMENGQRRWSSFERKHTRWRTLCVWNSSGNSWLELNFRQTKTYNNKCESNFIRFHASVILSHKIVTEIEKTKDNLKVDSAI